VAESSKSGFKGRVRSLVKAVQEGDEAQIEAAILRLSRRRRWLAPLGFAVGAFVLVFDALKLLVTNWRLTLVQVLPAMWIWLAMYDLRGHVLHDKTFNVIRGPVLIPLGLLIVTITAACYFLNAVFAFAVARPGRSEIRPALDEARRRKASIAIPGIIVGALLAFSVLVATRWGKPWFTLCLSIVVGVMMVSYVALPARLLGRRPTQSPRDKLANAAVGGALGFTVCTPPYLLGRLGLLMLGSKALLIPGILVFAVGITLQAGATGAVRAIKLSTRLAAGREPDGAGPAGRATPDAEARVRPVG
jgi:hypothetical protein